jgi:lipid-A-disaccharide synthase
MGRRLYIIAGEASGDLHGANLIKALKRIDPTVEVRAWGGDRMAAAGAEVVKHIRELAFMGFAEVVMNLRTIARNLRFCKADIAQWKPDAVVLIDYPGFNLRMAEYVHGLGIKVVYYISPQLWAWKAGRVEKVKRYVDRMLCILPFEKAWYAQRGVEVDFVGHPLLDAIAEEGAHRLAPLPGDDGRPVIALLPGSRKQEITRMLPAMLKAVEHYPGHRAVVAAAPSQPESLYRSLMQGREAVLVSGRTYDVLRSAHAALVTSGTATLETALFGVPEVVCYSGSGLSFAIAKRIVKVPFISLVNLIMEREVVRELIQGDMASGAIAQELGRLLNDGPYRENMISELGRLREKLGGAGASDVAAQLLWKTVFEGGGRP